VAVLPLALNYLATLRSYEGHLDAATALLEEADAISEATGNAPIVIGRLLLAGCRGDEAPALALLEESEAAAIGRGDGVLLAFGEYARAVLYNGLGRYEAALAPAQSASSRDELHASVWSLPELVEAAARCGRTDLAASALERLSERTRAAGTEWALGVEARSRALLCERPSAERFYREAIDRLGRCRVVFELARAHLLYGEWLRRARRRVDAREQLRRAQEIFALMGAEAFAARAGRELIATGETARKRTIETTDDLTPHEARIARMARDGASNQQIANQLFVSHKTVEYHLHNVFRKLGIRTREHLDRVLPRD
jgi:DNA-binding CsgD family transcriptional regulator